MGVVSIGVGVHYTIQTKELLSGQHQHPTSSASSSASSSLKLE
jgi:hypothetical protein